MAEKGRNEKIKTGENMVESLAEMFRCFICMEKLSNAHLCPHCSKLCCHHCITRWLSENHSHCPHCRAELNMRELVVCRWVEEVTQQLDSLQTFSPKQAAIPDVDICLIHSFEKLTVFCVTCHSCICHQCALWAGMHLGHSFMPLNEVYDAQVRKIDEQVEVTKRRHMELIGVVQEVEKNITSLRKSKDAKTVEVNHMVEDIVNRLETCFKNNVVRLIDQRCQLTQETELLDNLLMDVEHEKLSASKKELIGKSKTVLEMLHKVNEKASTSLTFTPVKADFVSELVPEYMTQTFQLDNFSRLQTRADPVYSPRLLVHGMVWRLKIYPDGNGVVRGNYLSVFLELSNGQNNTSKYEYRIEMVHPTVSDASKNVIREFASDFEVAECWGYNRFFRLDLLLSEGYLDNNDSLHLKLYVRQPTYQHKCNDLTWYIGLLESSRERHKQMAAALKKKVSQLEFQKLSVRRVSNLVDEEADDDDDEDEDYGQLASGSNLGNRNGAHGNEATLMVSRDQKLRKEEEDSETDVELDQLARLESSNEENDIDEETMFGVNNIDMSDDEEEEEEEGGEEEDDDDDLLNRYSFGAFSLTSSINSMELEDTPPNNINNNINNVGNNAIISETTTNIVTPTTTTNIVTATTTIIASSNNSNNSNSNRHVHNVDNYRQIDAMLFFQDISNLPSFSGHITNNNAITSITNNNATTSITNNKATTSSTNNNTDACYNNTIIKTYSNRNNNNNRKNKTSKESLQSTNTVQFCSLSNQAANDPLSLTTYSLRPTATSKLAATANHTVASGTLATTVNLDASTSTTSSGASDVDDGFLSKSLLRLLRSKKSVFGERKRLNELIFDQATSNNNVYEDNNIYENNIYEDSNNTIYEDDNTNDVNNSIQTSVRAIKAAQDAFSATLAAASSAGETTYFSSLPTSSSIAPFFKNPFVALSSSLSAKSLIPLPLSPSSSSSVQATTSPTSHHSSSLSSLALFPPLTLSTTNTNNSSTPVILPFNPTSSSSPPSPLYFPSIASSAIPSSRAGETNGDRGIVRKDVNKSNGNS